MFHELQNSLPGSGLATCCCAEECNLNTDCCFLRRLHHPTHLVIPPQNSSRLRDKAQGLGVNACLRVERVKKTTLWQYQHGQQRQYLKVTMALPTLVTPARSEWGDLEGKGVG